MRPEIGIKLHPEFLKKNGKIEFVVLPYEEFLTLRQILADAEDVLEIRAAKKKEKNAPTTPLAKVKKNISQ